MWDYAPAKGVAGMIFPIAEYLLQGYLILSLLQVRQSMISGIVTASFFWVRSMMTPLEILLISWVRIIFIFDAEVNLKGHTAGFLCLQVATMLIASQNVLYYYVVGLMPFQRQLGERFALIVSVAYLGLLMVSTIAKMTITVSIFSGSLFLDTKMDVGATIAQFFDILWMICGTVVPAVSACGQRRQTPPVLISGLAETKECGFERV